MGSRTLAVVLTAAASLTACATATSPPDRALEPAGAATDSRPASVPRRWSNTIRWATASEVENLGYHVYRGESEQGPWIRLTTELIPGAGTTDEPSRYRFEDDTIEPTKVYFYWVESVSIDGVRERFTPIARVGPKVTRESREKHARSRRAPAEGGT